MVFGIAVIDGALYACVFAWLLSMPRDFGIPWRDISTFDPSIVCGLCIGVALAALAVVARIVAAIVIGVAQMNSHR